MPNKMRADKRSFSFTWMRGQKSTEDNDMTDVSTASRLERSNTTWYMTNASTSSSSSGVSSMSDSSSIASTSTRNDSSGKENGLTGSDSKGRLRRLGSSFTRFGTKYSIIEDDDEAMQQGPLESDGVVNAAASIEQEEPVGMVVEQQKQQQPTHFDEDGNFIGRSGKTSCSRRKSCTSGKEVGPSASFGKRINKTVQEVKATIGNFSQKFRRSTRRRYRMGHNSTPLSDLTPTRKILGRTPTKLYSPFGIGFESPAFKTPKRLGDRPSTPRLTRRSMVSGLAYSPANSFGQDLAEARRGMEDFHILTRDITRRSVRF